MRTLKDGTPVSDVLLDDGTPVGDVLEELREKTDEILVMKRAFRAIGALCENPHWTADRRWKILEIANDPSKASKRA